MPNDKFYSSGTWRRIRTLVVKRDLGRCVICGDTKGLQVDHIKPRKEYPHLAYNTSNLRTLCAKCHAKTGTSFGRQGDAQVVLKPKTDYNGFPEGGDW
jgi:5-methylcytosine-specific restriction endonuclease McrA